jgi:putative ABC transport system permease protein
MQVDRIQHLGGVWPPARREVLLERLSPNLIGAQVGDVLKVELDNGIIKPLTVAGLVHDPQQL